MKTDYMYCVNKGSCIHRRGCKRWIGNYTDIEISEFNKKIQHISLADESKCIPNLKDTNCENNYSFLDRFRLSTGEPFKDDRNW